MSEENKLNAMIVRNIDDIDAAYSRATNEIETALTREVAAIFSEAAKSESWEGSDDDASLDELWLAPAEWWSEGQDDEDEEYDLFLTLGYDGKADLTWLATFLGSGDLRLGIFLDSNALTESRWRKLVRSLDPGLINKLAAAGFSVDASKGFIALYVKIDKEALAKGFEDGDIAESLGPIADALAQAVKARPVLDELGTLVRKKTA